MFSGVLKALSEAWQRRKRVYQQREKVLEWLSRNYERIRDAFENPKLTNYIFSPFYKLWESADNSRKGQIESVITKVAIANTVMAALPGKMGAGVIVSMALEAYMAFVIARVVGVKVDSYRDILHYFGVLSGIVGTIFFGFRALLGFAFSAASLIPGVNPLIIAEFFVTCFVGVLFWVGFEEVKADKPFRIPFRMARQIAVRTRSISFHQWDALKQTLTPGNIKLTGQRLWAWFSGDLAIPDHVKPELRGDALVAVSMAYFLSGNFERLDGPMGKIFIQSIRDRFPDLSEAPLSEISEHMRSYTDEQIPGVINVIKGKMFEHIEMIHENTDGDEWIAYLHDDESFPGSDMVITNVETGVAVELSLKATENSRYVEEALLKYPDIPIKVTSEVGEEMDHSDWVEASHFSHAELQRVTQENFETLVEELDSMAVAGTVSGIRSATALWPFVVAYMRGRIDSDQLQRAIVGALPQAGEDLAIKLTLAAILGPVYAWWILASATMRVTPDVDQGAQGRKDSAKVLRLEWRPVGTV